METIPGLDLPFPVDETLYQEMVAFRRDMHRHPELAGKESRTAEKVAAYLERLGIPWRGGLAGGHGIVARIEGLDSSRGTIALRADLDALPIHEETGLDFSSVNEGVMHACAHDGHTSQLLGAAALLATGDPPPVPVTLLFQPAEETGQGALRMIEDGALEDVAMVFGGHIDRHYPLGKILVSEGAVNASSDRFLASIAGKGGHAARPHETVDAVVAGSLLVMSLQTIVSREVNPDHPSVVTVGTFEAGTAHNVISDHARLSGTIRAQDQEVREYLHASLKRITQAVGQLHGAEITLKIDEGTPAVINRPAMAALAREAATSVVGPDHVQPLEVANMGGEDFGYYLRERPGCYVRFGTRVEGVEAYPAHSSRFDFDERTLGIAAAYYRSLAFVAGNALLEETTT